MEINCDGVKISENSDKDGSITPILACVHSIKKDADCQDPPFMIYGAKPFIVGFHIGGKVDSNQYLEPLYDELVRLDPGNNAAPFFLFDVFTIAFLISLFMFGGGKLDEKIKYKREGKREQKRIRLVI